MFYLTFRIFWNCMMIKWFFFALLRITKEWNEKYGKCDLLCVLHKNWRTATDTNIYNTLFCCFIIAYSQGKTLLFFQNFQLFQYWNGGSNWNTHSMKSQSWVGAWVETMPFGRAQTLAMWTISSVPNVRTVRDCDSTEMENYILNLWQKKRMWEKNMDE